ncbi:PREDICTED: putative clathrin assembly protein At1g25240 [Tarenaya hassleriana]|uniref:putative clathrin assembly protein At1g25240 n=1 Tax=Tarenaya hassleriana TaxID=28532 RepID=UPI00053C12DD|nr:PREDICTED: putative clathrin assembly protein At1g25240 [Tarenaya hassleriana]
MKLWKRAAAALKDRKSLLTASLTRRSTVQNPDLETAVIHATNHDDSSVDYKNAHRVYKWIRASPANLRPLVHVLSCRVDRSRSWVVALKSLMLIHGVLCCKVPSLSEIRRLPFDLSAFSDGHSRPSKTWGFNAFVRAYYAFLDQYSFFLSEQIQRHRENRKLGQKDSSSLSQDLEQIQKFQSLLDILLQIRPMGENMRRTLILEAMDCVVIEITDIYGRICSSISKILVKIHQRATKSEAATALKIVQKAMSQGEELALYFEFCKEFGVSNAHKIPQFVRIPEEEIQTIERIINGAEEKPKKEEPEEEKAIILVEKQPELQTIITDKWEVFEEEDYYYNNRGEETKVTDEQHRKDEDKNLMTMMMMPLIVIDEPVYIHHTIPDLITF